MSDTLTKTQAAITAGLSERSIDRAVQLGLLPATKTSNGRILISRECLKRWIEARQIAGRRRAKPLDQTLDYARRVVALECGASAEETHA